MTLEIDTPFNIGDKVYFEISKRKTEKIICPFCNGKPQIDTGLEHWTYKPPLRKLMKKEDWYLAPLILKCKNCTDGEIYYDKEPEVEIVSGTIISVLRYEGKEYYGHQTIKFLVRCDNGKELELEDNEIHHEIFTNEVL